MRGVGVGCVAGVWRVCQGVCRVCQGVSRACGGCVGGVCRGVLCLDAGCAVCPGARDSPPLPLRPRGWMEAVWPGVRDPPPLPWAIASACVLDAGCAVLRLSFPPRSPRDFLFSASCLWPLVFVCPQGPALPSPGNFLFSPGNQTDTDTRLLCDVRCARRFYSPSPSSATAVPTAPQRTQLFAVALHTHATPNFTPPLKTPPRPSGTQHAARNGCRAST